MIKGCYLCPRNLPPLPDGGTTLKWRLSDAHNQYGILLATLPVGRHLSHDQQQLVDTLVEQLTSTLALDRHQEKQQQLIVMEERATIARELHDSIAQSLSRMKMQVSCLQMQGRRLTGGEPPAAGADTQRAEYLLGPAAGAVNHLPPATDRAGTAPGAGGQLSGVQRPLRLYGTA